MDWGEPEECCGEKDPLGKCTGSLHFKDCPARDPELTTLKVQIAYSEPDPSYFVLGKHVGGI